VEPSFPVGAHLRRQGRRTLWPMAHRLRPPFADAHHRFGERHTVRPDHDSDDRATGSVQLDAYVLGGARIVHPELHRRCRESHRASADQIDPSALADRERAIEPRHGELLHIVTADTGIDDLDRRTRDRHAASVDDDAGQRESAFQHERTLRLRAGFDVDLLDEIRTADRVHSQRSWRERGEARLALGIGGAARAADTEVVAVATEDHRVADGELRFVLVANVHHERARRRWRADWNQGARRLGRIDRGW
jgi:hypothetical protein